MYLDTLFHLNPLSPCVDAGDPNELDYYMPEGLVALVLMQECMEDLTGIGG